MTTNPTRAVEVALLYSVGRFLVATALVVVGTWLLFGPRAAGAVLIAGGVAVFISGGNRGPA